MARRKSAAAKRDIDFGIHPYTDLARHPERGPHVITKGKGIYIYDDEGKEYIEGMAGLWSTSFGFGEEELIQAAIKQMRELPTYHVFNSKSSGPFIDLAAKLVEITPKQLKHVFFANSGSEANDTLVKMVWYINNALGKHDKKKVISRVRGYHGVTIAAASLTGVPSNHTDFDLPIANFLHTDCPDYFTGGKPGESEEAFATRLADNLEKMILDEGPDTIAAFIAEPVMGAGGVVVPPKGYFKKIQAVLRKYDVLFFDDEVICGFGRTGNLFGAETFGLKPDAMALGKQLSSAYLPISAVMITDHMHKSLVSESRKLGTFAHGFTYGGHPVSAAVALRTIELMEERDMVGHVQKVAPVFQKRLRTFADHPMVGDARGVGLLGALELVADKKTNRAFEPKGKVGSYLAERTEVHGLISRNLGEILAFCPPQIITEAEIEELFDRFSKALDDTYEWVQRENLAAA